MPWVDILFYALKLADRTWDLVDSKAVRSIQNDVKRLVNENNQAIIDGDVEKANATRAALDEISRRLRARAE